MNDIQYLKTFGTDYAKKSLFQKIADERKYSRSEIVIGNIITTDDNHRKNGSEYAIDFSEANRICTVGMTRSGKTWCYRVLGDRLYKAGRSVCYLFDPKNEFKSSRYPLQPKFYSLLNKNEKPQGFKIVTLRPTFFMDINKYKDLSRDNFWYSIEPASLSKSDFMTLFNSTRVTLAQQTALDLLYEILMSKYNKNKKLNFYDTLLDSVDELEDFNDSQKSALKRMFSPLRNSHFFMEDYSRNIVKLIQKGYILCFNMEGFDLLGDSPFLFPEVLLSVVHREIVDARRSGKIKPVYLFLDESVRFIGKNIKTSIKHDIKESFDLNTRYNINYNIATQNISDIDSNMIDQCRYIFLPYNVTTSIIQQTIMSLGMTRNQQISVNTSIRIKRKLQQNKYAWAVFDRNKGCHYIIKTLAPLSMHEETTE